MSTRTNDPGEDRSLVTDYLATRDEAAFRRLYRRHTPGLFGLAFRLSGSRREEAEEVVQETWIRVCRRLPSFRWDSSLRTWLCGIAVRCLQERRRAASRRPEEALHPEVSPPDASAARPGDGLDLERAIAGLPERSRQILVLRDIQGYTHEEIGELLEIHPGTSKSYLFRARRALREALRRTEEDRDVAPHRRHG